MSVVGERCVMCSRVIPWFGWCSFCFPGQQMPDLYGPRGTELYLGNPGVSVGPPQSWARCVTEWRQRQARGFDRSELALPSAPTGGAT